MSASDVYVTFGGDTKGLEASLASLKAQLTAATREMGTLARQQAATGAGVESELGQKLLAAAGKVTELKGAIGGLRVEMSGAGGAAGGAHAVAGAIEHVTAAAGGHGHGTGIGFYLREFHALMDEFGSGRTRQGIGTLSNVIFTFLQANSAFVPAAVGIGAVAAAFGYLAYQAHAASAAVNSIQFDAAENQFQLTDQQAAKLRDSIKSLAGVSAGDAEEIAKPFLALGPVGAILAQLASVHMPALAGGEKKLSEVSAEVAKRFTDLTGAGLKYVTSSRSATAAQREEYQSAINAGNATKAYSIILDLMGKPLDTLAQKQKLARAALIDHAAAQSDARLAGQDFAESEGRVSEATAAATAQIDRQAAALPALRQQLLSASNAAEQFKTGMNEALKVDKISGDIKDTQGEIAKLQAGIAAAGDKSSPAIDAMGRALDIARDKLKKLQQQFADPVVGSNQDLLQRTKEQIAADDAAFKGSTVAKLQADRATEAALLQNAQITADQRKEILQDLARKDNEIRDAQARADQRQDEIRIAQAGKNSAAVIAIREEEVKRAIAAYGKGSDQELEAEDKLAKAREAAANKGAAAATKAARDALGASEQGLQGEIQIAEKTADDKIKIYTLEAKAKQITETQKLAYTKAALADEKKAVDAAYASELALSGLTATKREEITRQLTLFNLENVDKVKTAEEQAAVKATQAWDSATKSINSAFDSQINGLLTGTTSWGQAFKNVLKDLTEQTIKFFVNWGLEQAENAAKSIVLNNSVVTAKVAGDATMASADQGAAAAGALGWLGTALHAIEASAAEAFAGVFGFLAPVLGPAAIGPAAGAQATVLAAGGAVASADIGMWSVPQDMLTMVHHNELIMPASQAGAFRGLLSSGGVGGAAPSAAGGGKSVNINPQTHFHVSAVDGASTAQFFRNNSRELMKAVDEAVRHGAHLGTRRLSMA